MFKKFFLALVILLIAGLSFGLGLLYGGGEREGIQIEYNPEISNSASVLNAIENYKLKIENSIQVVASKNGKKYHYLHCPGTKQISETNKIVFVSSEVAETSGYTLASNCKPR